ncbi:hypothetical protein BJD99_01530 [Rhodococcus sp. 1163]|uniref:hypothetical protein n=1 Tax=Rhodococcus sp. 1163 TaxID=1905289 RepID=UPI0009FDF038|nr:hypothetical protein [Rhodococcus sp. 1163]ORI19719.1 hypothetical protein BJD99_01530 [Rhodococcus sp. 1163]
MSASIPLPGQHRQHDGRADMPAVDPSVVEAEVDELLARLPSTDAISGDLNTHAQILDHAHEVLVQALSAVDKS